MHVMRLGNIEVWLMQSHTPQTCCVHVQLEWQAAGVARGDSLGHFFLPKVCLHSLVNGGAWRCIVGSRRYRMDTPDPSSNKAVTNEAGNCLLQ